MEQEELELINRLKHTKQQEEAAHNELEGALNNPLPDLDAQARASGFSGAGRGRGKTGSRGGRRM